ncbi:hypothetical protein V8E55_002327, partial [Tylopilus felleus]
KMSSTQIVSLLEQRDPVTFAGLSCTTVDSWIDHSGNKPKWSLHALKMARDGNDPGLGNKGGRWGIFEYFPTVEKAIIDWLDALHNRSVPLTLVTIKGIIVAMLMDMVPEIFDVQASDRSSFQCSDNFLYM